MLWVSKPPARGEGRMDLHKDAGSCPKRRAVLVVEREIVAAAATDGAAVSDAVLPTCQRSFGRASFDFSEFMLVGWEVRAVASSRDS